MPWLRENPSSALDPGCPLYGKYLLSTSRVLQLVSMLLVTAVPSFPLAQLAPVPWVIITDLLWHCLYHSSGEIFLTPWLPGHSLHSVPYQKALEHCVGVFFIALTYQTCWRVKWGPISRWWHGSGSLEFWFQVNQETSLGLSVPVEIVMSSLVNFPGITFKLCNFQVFKELSEL